MPRAAARPGVELRRLAASQGCPSWPAAARSPWGQHAAVPAPSKPWGISPSRTEGQQSSGQYRSVLATSLAAGAVVAARRLRRGRAAGSQASEGKPEGGTDTFAASLNLAKNLVGSGMLSLPVGVAAFSSNPAALWPSLVLLVLAALLSAYTFCLIGRVCEETGTSSFGSAWEKTFKWGAWVPQLVCILECLGGSIVYAMVLGDVFSALLQGVGGLPAFLTTRSGVIGVISATVLFPLCCLRSFGQLAKFSLLGTLASSFVVAFVAKRFFDGSYAPKGEFFSASLQNVLDGSEAVGLNPRMLILVSILSTAYLMHFNAPQMYAEMKPSKPHLSPSEKVEKEQRFAKVALFGFGIAGLQYSFTMVFGFLTFGRSTQGNLLLNYAPGDPWAVAARAAVGVSMLFGYPMQFAGFRDGILEAFGVKSLPTGQHRLVTGVLLAGAVSIACLFNDLGSFQALEGAVLASFLLYIAPPLMALRFEKSLLKRTGFLTVVILGVAMGAIGCWVTVHP